MSIATLPQTAVGRPRRPYPDYKPSGIEWLGAMPAHWRVSRLKYVATINPAVLPEDTHPDHIMHYVDIGNVDSNGTIVGAQDVRFEDAPSRARRIVQDGDVIVSTVRTYLKAIAFIRDAANNLVVSTGFAVLRAKVDVPIYPGYLGWLVRATVFVDTVVSHSEGVSYPAIAPTVLASFPIWIPPQAEQQAIAAFLDRETAKIDALIAKKERQVELLGEKRAGLIDRVITRGLDETAPMRASWMETVGDIPLHWEAKKLKFIAPAITVGIVVTPASYYVDDGVPCLRSLNVKERWIDDSQLVFISESSHRMLRKSAIFAGDLVVVRTGQPGTTSVVDQRFDGANCIDLIIIRQSLHFDSSFMAYVANSHMAKVQYTLGSNGALQQHFNVETAKNLTIHLPPLQEQCDIVAYLDRQTTKIDTLIAKVHVHIATLREHRTALITAAVTGKIDVREGAPQW